jgi:hypothetical protein
MKVYGNEKDLRKFQNDLCGDGESAYSFKLKEPKLEGTHDSNRDYIWNIGKGIEKCVCINLSVSERNDHLLYHFATSYHIPYLIYDNLIRSYKNLDFKIQIYEVMNQWQHQIVTSGGKYIKDNWEDWASIKWKENLYISLLYIIDYLNDNKITIINALVHKDDEKIPFLEPASSLKRNDYEHMYANPLIDN